MNRSSVFILSLVATGLLLGIYNFAYLDRSETVAQQKYAPVVQINGGKVRGIVTGKDLHLYQGIRYGRAKRFSRPTAVEPWTGIYDATKWRAACPQFGAPIEHNWQKNWSRIEDEDCLYLSVWKPAAYKVNRSTLVWIHGGAFEMNSIFTSDYDCQYLAQQGDVIVVSLQYRLGPLGFLYGGGEYQGNWGLFDLLLGLQFVHENIKFFGGNPSDVTVAGQSAGAMCLGNLLLLPQSKGLFQRAILQSGSPTATTDSVSQALEKSQRLARKVGCPIDDATKMVHCLQAKPFHELAIPLYGDLSRNEYFTPVYGNDSSLLKLSPLELVKSAKLDVDLMFGVVRDEGSVFVEQFAPAVKANNLTVELIKTEIAKLMDKMKQSKHRKEIAEFYTKDLVNATQDDLRIAIANAFGDFLFVCNEVLFAQQIALNAPNKRYFAYRLMQNPHGYSEPGYQPWMGVPHATDNQFLFTVPANTSLDEPTLQLSRGMLNAWTSFTKFATPMQMDGIKWEEAFPNKRKPVTRFMSLKFGEYKMVEDFFSDTCDHFWKPLIFA